MISTSIAMPSVATIASAQITADGAPRFQIPAMPDDPAWLGAAAQEADGGMDADVRVFLDAQLETGDVLLDLAPGFGFVALGATTAPGGLPTVFVSGLSDDRMQALQDAAVDVGGWLERLDIGDTDTLAALVDSRLDTDGRVFVHASALMIGPVCAQLKPLIDASRVLALCIGDAAQSGDWSLVLTDLHAAGFEACTLVDVNGEPTVVPVEGAPASAVIALPHALVQPNDAPGAHDTTSTTRIGSQRFALVGGWAGVRDGLHLLAPHSRTGYGVAGAHLLRALRGAQVPVAFHPIGPLDRSITDATHLDATLASEMVVHPDAPSVRLSQQFDLTTHAGQGATAGFTIFERDAFTEQELAGMRAQDALIVCSEWARGVCIANGLGDTPIHVVPLGVDRAIFHEGVEARQRTTDTVFMQVGKLEPRKGQLELLRAFESAFSPNDSVRLVLSCTNPFIGRDEMDALLAPFRRSSLASRITVRTAELASLRAVADVMAAADCGVFAARAEGWNLEALEMLSMGKQVIATDFAAHTEYMNASNARLVHIDTMEPALGGALPGRWAAWQASQHEQLIAHLRAVHAERQGGSLALNTAGIDTAKRFTWDASVDALVRALEQIA